MVPALRDGRSDGGAGPDRFPLSGRHPSRFWNPAADAGDCPAPLDGSVLQMLEWKGLDEARTTLRRRDFELAWILHGR